MILMILPQFTTSYRKEILKFGTFVLLISFPSEPTKKYLSPSQRNCERRGRNGIREAYAKLSFMLKSLQVQVNEPFPCIRTWV